MMNIELDNDYEKMAAIKVLGVGGGGGNAVNRMIQSGMSSVEFISVNTDNQSLRFSNASYKLHIGDKLTRGQGAGGDPMKGEKAAEESEDEITSVLRGADMVYITAGMGGGTGTGAAPVIARIAHDRLKEHVDALLVIPNERLRSISQEKITLANAFAKADEVLLQAVQSISDLINIPGIINLDFADVTSIMKDAGYAHMGLGAASGPNKAEEAARMAIASPLLETSINGARGVIVNFLVPPDVDLEDITNASQMIHDAAHPDVNLIWGVAFDEKLEDEIKIVVIATNFDHESGFRIPTPPVDTEVPEDKITEVEPQTEQEPINDDLDISALIDMLNHDRDKRS